MVTAVETASIVVCGDGSGDGISYSVRNNRSNGNTGGGNDNNGFMGEKRWVREILELEK